MCILFIAIEQHPHFPLIIAANRDEFADRSTCRVHCWEAPNDFLGGRDLEAGGAWLGVSTKEAQSSRKFALLTNVAPNVSKTRGYPPAAQEGAPSRGAIVPGFLTSPEHCTGQMYCQQLARSEAKRYAGFNLIAGEVVHSRPLALSCSYFTNRSEDGGQILTPGFYAISNDAVLESNWSKTVRGKGLFRRVVDKHGGCRWAERNKLVSSLFGTLLEDQHSDESWSPATPIFMRRAHYCTRASTVIMVHASGAVQFTERNHDTDEDDDHAFTLPRSGAEARL